LRWDHRLLTGGRLRGGGRASGRQTSGLGLFAGTAAKRAVGLLKTPLPRETLAGEEIEMATVEVLAGHRLSSERGSAKQR